MPKTAVKNYQPSPKVLACRINGRKGGLARAKKNSSKQIKLWSSKGGRTTADLYGSDYFAFIIGKRKHVGRYRKPSALATEHEKPYVYKGKLKPDTSKVSNAKARRAFESKVAVGTPILRPRKKK